MACYEAKDKEDNVADRREEKALGSLNYRTYVLGQLKEIVEGYHPDSLFLDIFGKSLCYCETCCAKFEEAYGYALPTSEEDILAHVKDINDFLDTSAYEMLKEIKETLHAIDPTLKITINFAALYNKGIRDELDYQFTEPWAGNWLSAAYSRDTAKGQFPQLGPGNVSEVYNYRHDNVYLLAAAEIAAQGCRVFMYSGSQRPDGSLEYTEARKIGKAYREVEKFEHYLNDREVIADVAILQSDVAHQAIKQTSFVPNAMGRVRTNSLHREAVLGAMKLCDQAQVTWKVVPEQEVILATLSKHKVVLLPSVYYISSQLQETLEQYVAAGGSLERKSVV